MTPDTSVEDRVARLEQLLDRLIAYARTTPFGRAVLAKLDLR
jgi:hypothetical protein